MFYRNKCSKSGLRPDCKDCHRSMQAPYRESHKDECESRAKAWHEKNPGKRKQYQRASRYGLTQEAYDSMLAGQCGKCAICGNNAGANERGGDLYVDHDHASGVVRGLLCRSCNVLLGHAKDDVTILARAIEYLASKAVS